MNNETHDKSRRTLLKGLVSIPVVTLAGISAAQAAMLATNDPMAMALQYTASSTMADKTCANCALYQGGAAATGACPIFAGKDVAAAGWCASWVIKP
ncbi:MAG: high-potential iron-sulfur protein [Gammaproteobacteria bacterium]|nr:high-potential iron-sulfur protein [Gammaproteobacteria bacterium]